MAYEYEAFFHSSAPVHWCTGAHWCTRAEESLGINIIHIALKTNNVTLCRLSSTVLAVVNVQLRDVSNSISSTEFGSGTSSNYNFESLIIEPIELLID